MLQILIADDEKKIRQGLRNIVDWEALGYQIAGEAANGEEAVSFLAARRPDVVLLDISMPKCNGLEVVRRAQEQGFSGKVIILSGYSDFKYAQEAIRLGVKFYLTKPIDEKELEQLLLQLKEEIAEESKKRAAATNYYQRARETILRDLFLKPGNVALLDLVDMNTAAVEYQVVLYERYVSQQKDMGFSFERFLRVNNQENHLFDLIELEQAQGVLLKGEGVIRRFHELLEQCAEQAANSLPTALDHVFLAYGRKVSTLGEIHLSYEDAHLLLSRKFFTEQKQHVVGYEQLLRSDTFPLALDSALLESYCAPFLRYVQSFNRNMLAVKLHELESQLYNIHYDRKETLYFLKQGRPLLVTGVQCHNSSTGTGMLQDAIQVAKEFHGNVLEAPVYWYLLEPQQGVYDTSHVRELIHTVRKAGLHLVILWFATNKNGHPNYALEYIKLDPDTYRLAVEPDGLPVPSLSPHCQATLRADQKAFVELMKCIKEEDGDCGTVLAVQVENEAGLGGTDRDYSQAAQRDFENGVPPELEGVEIPDSGASMRDNSWRGRFSRHANEAFTAWYQARYIEEIAAAGKQVYNIPMYVNAMLGHPYSEAGMAYNSGGPTVRVLDIWKKAAPSIDLLCPDIYMPCRDYYTHFCQAYSREDNALFIPESSFAGPSAALNVIRAAAQYEAVGVCCFGAESALDENGDLRKEVEDTAVSFQMVRNMAPLLLQYHGTGRIHAILQEEFMDQQLILTEGFRIVAHFDIRRRIPDTRETLPRGRGILVQTGEYEFYLTGDNVALDFVVRPDPEEEMPRFWMACRQSNQLNFLTVEEGHFDEQNQWVVDFRRNGDETNYETYARKGEVVRIRLNPKMGKKGFVKA